MKAKEKPQVPTVTAVKDGKSVTISLPNYLAWRCLALYRDKRAAFGRDLGVSRAHVSALISGKRNLTPQLLAKLNEVDPEFTLTLPPPAYQVTFKKKRQKKEGFTDL